MALWLGKSVLLKDRRSIIKERSKLIHKVQILNLTHKMLSKVFNAFLKEIEHT
jgi:hypothetical protein